MPMVKSILLKGNSPLNPRPGFQHSRQGLNTTRQGMDCLHCLRGARTEHTISVCKAKSFPPKGINELYVGTCGWPKVSNDYGHRAPIVPANAHSNVWRGGRGVGPIVVNGKRYCSGGARVEQTQILEKLTSLSNFCNKFPEAEVDRKLYAMLCDKQLLQMAYHKIKSKPGYMTSGLTPETLDGLNAEWLDSTVQMLKDESFQFKPGRRVQIPKPQGGLRPLTVAPARDKIIQEAMRTLLEIVYTPTFSPNSHGFQRNKSCHTALKQVYWQFRGSSWVIEGDITKCFDSIDHHRLMSIIEAKIQDRRFTRLLWKALRAGYYEFRTYHHSVTGTPQGSIISPILSNIFLNQLDQFMDGLKSEFDMGAKPSRNPAYASLTQKIKYRRAHNRRSEIKSLKAKASQLPSILFADPKYKRLHYVRYADDWIIGIRGSHTDCVAIMDRVRNYLSELDLSLNMEKTKITNLSKQLVLFLGTYIFRSHHRKYLRSKIGTTGRLPMALRMEAPINRVVKKLREAAFVTERLNPTPKFALLHRSAPEIIHIYNSVYRGYSNYYSFVHNRSKFIGVVHYILKGSCLRLLAAKYSTSSRKLIQRYGKDLRGVGAAFVDPDYKTDPNRFLSGPTKPLYKGCSNTPNQPRTYGI
jgi:group II intron reverse transcriptase/maturase